MPLRQGCENKTRRFVASLSARVLDEILGDLPQVTIHLQPPCCCHHSRFLDLGGSSNSFWVIYMLSSTRYDNVSSPWPRDLIYILTHTHILFGGCSLPIATVSIASLCRFILTTIQLDPGLNHSGSAMAIIDAARLLELGDSNK